MRKLFIYLVCQMLLGTVSVSAQSFEEYKRQQQAKFNSYAQKKTEEFRAYREAHDARGRASARLG